MAAASATSISEDTDVKGSDVVSESEKEPGSDLISESEKTLGDASFCTDCEWKQMGFTCGFRVMFLVDHYRVKEEEAMQSLLDDGDCLPMADQEVAGGSMAAASATSISENTKGSDVVSESEKKPVPDVTSESEKEPG